MLRTISGTVAGLIIGFAIIMGVETLSHIIYPPPAGVDLKDPEQLKAIMHDIPIGAKLGVLIAWGLGVFGGGTAAVLFTGRKKLPATFVAAVLFLGAVATLFMIPHPLWMIIGTIIVTLLGWYGATRFAGQDSFPPDSFS